jgi:choline kinase
MGQRFESFDSPKCLLPLPGGQTVLGRLLEQIYQIGYFNEVVLLLGYKAVEVTRPEIPHILISDPDNPKNLMSGIASYLDSSDYEKYSFLLGDTVWSTKVLHDCLDYDGPSGNPRSGIRYFSSKRDVGGETFMVDVCNAWGNEFIRSYCKTRPLTFSPFGNLHRSHLGRRQPCMKFESAKLNDFYRHIQVTAEAPGFRKIVTTSVMDIDNNEDYAKALVFAEQNPVK